MVPAPAIYVAASGILFLLIRWIFDAVERRDHRQKTLSAKQMNQAKIEEKVPIP